MTQDKVKGSAAGVSAQVGGLELKYINRVDIQERVNIISARYTCDDQLVSPDAKDFISKVRHVSSAGQHGTLHSNRTPVSRNAYLFCTRALSTGHCT